MPLHALALRLCYTIPPPFRNPAARLLHYNSSFRGNFVPLHSLALRLCRTIPLPFRNPAILRFQSHSNTRANFVPLHSLALRLCCTIPLPSRNPATLLVLYNSARLVLLVHLHPHFPLVEARLLSLENPLLMSLHLQSRQDPQNSLHQGQTAPRPKTRYHHLFHTRKLDQYYAAPQILHFHRRCTLLMDMRRLRLPGTVKRPGSPIAVFF